MTRLRNRAVSSVAREASAAAWAALAAARVPADRKAAREEHVPRVAVLREARVAQHLKDSDSEN